MNTLVAVPKIFLRGNRWYVRVQVPKAMQVECGRKEYWVSLGTSDRSAALQRAPVAAQNKRRKLGNDVDQANNDGDTKLDYSVVQRHEPDDQQLNGTDDLLDDCDAISTSTPSKTGKYDALTKTQLIQLLEEQDQTKKLGLVWERDDTSTNDEPDQVITVAELDVELSDGPAPWDNMVIEGDNLDALLWLRMTHRGRVKCIYIDPPYNTGNRNWVYNDHYKNADDRFDQSAWLEFLHQRLVVARDLLTDDGVILMSINDEQRALAELMMKQALPRMRLGSLVWRTRNGSNASQSGYLSPDHEHILVAAKAGFSFAGSEKNYATYANPDSDHRGDWQAVPMKLGFSKDERPNLYYPLRDPSTGIYYPCNPDSVWRFAKRERVSKGQRLQTQPIEDFIDQGRIIFPVNQRVETYDTIEDLEAAIDRMDVPVSGGVPILRRDLLDLSFWVGKRIGFGTPSRKLFKSELKRPTKPLSSWVQGYADVRSDDDTNSITAGSYTEGSRELRSVFGSKVFNYAKPVSLIRELVRQVTSHNDLVLDFFAGSATTAQAVMELNAEDGGNRRFIMVSSTEATTDEPAKNLCRDVTAERVRLLNASDDKKYSNLSAGFSYLRTKSISHGNLEYELKPSDAWTCLEGYHRLPLTTYDPDQPWNTHEAEAVTLVLVDRFDLALVEWLRPRSAQNVHVYAWAKGPFTQQLHDIGLQVSPVIETLADEFRA